jgi:hypothetical protein
MIVGTPNMQIHPENIAAATFYCEGVSQGSASIQRLILSITSLGGCEGVQQVDVDVGETALGNWNRVWADLKMAMDF